MDSRLIKIGLFVVAAVAVLGGVVVVTGIRYVPKSATEPTQTPHQTSFVAKPKTPRIVHFNPHDFAFTQEVRAARDLLDRNLPDFPSARFKDVEAIYYLPGNNPANHVLCGQINAKNRFGAYAGFKQFAVATDVSGRVSIYLESDDDTIASDLCLGRGWAGLKHAQENESDKMRLYTTDPAKLGQAGDDLINRLKDLAAGRIEMDPILSWNIYARDYTDSMTSGPVAIPSNYVVDDASVTDQQQLVVGQNSQQVFKFATDDASRTYGADGISGLAIKEAKCYDSAAQGGVLYCVAFDAASEMIVESLQNDSPPPEFGRATFEARAKDNLKKFLVTDKHAQKQIIASALQSSAAYLNQFAAEHR